jgi:hypothetical protein
MAIKFVDLDRINKAFSKTKQKRALTEDTVREMIADTTVSILEQSHVTGKKGKEKRTAISKVLKKSGDAWYLRLFYGVSVVCGAEIEAANEQQAIKEAIDYCNDIKKGKCDSKTKEHIRKAFEEKQKSLAEAKATRARNKKMKVAA